MGRREVCSAAAARAAAWAPLTVGPTASNGELEAMRLEGLVVHLAGAVYLPADAVAFTASRVAALRLLAPPGGVVGLLAAAWAHGVPTRPDPVDVLVRRAAAAGRRTRGVRERECVVPAADVVHLDGLPVTSPARTAADVARACPPDVARGVVGTLVAAGVDPDQILAALPRARRYPGAVRARELVTAVTAQPSGGR